MYGCLSGKGHWHVRWKKSGNGFLLRIFWRSSGGKRCFYFSGSSGHRGYLGKFRPPGDLTIVGGEVIRVVLEGLLLGLSSGVYCLGTCLVFFMPYLLAEGRQNVFENFRKIALFMLGRFVAYILFALLMGFISVTHRNIFSAKFSYFSLIIASLLMLFYSFTRSFPGSRFCMVHLPKFNLVRMPFFLGVFSGLNPCLPFLTGVSRLWTLQSVFQGVILFTGFFLGTSLYMIPLISVSYLNRIERVRQIGLILTGITGAWFLFVGLSAVIK